MNTQDLTKKEGEIMSKQGTCEENQEMSDQQIDVEDLSVEKADAKQVKGGAWYPKIDGVKG